MCLSICKFLHLPSEWQNQVEVTTRQENDWVEYDPHDLKTYPKEGALVEAALFAEARISTSRVEREAA